MKCNCKKTPTQEVVYEIHFALQWIALAKTVFGESRSLKDWERETLDEFTWSELESRILSETYDTTKSARCSMFPKWPIQKSQPQP